MVKLPLGSLGMVPLDRGVSTTGASVHTWRTGHNDHDPQTGMSLDSSNFHAVTGHTCEGIGPYPTMEADWRFWVGAIFLFKDLASAFRPGEDSTLNSQRYPVAQWIPPSQSRVWWESQEETVPMLVLPTRLQLDPRFLFGGYPSLSVS